jgi:hypothetical protein
MFLLLLAAASLPPFLLCTVETVQSSWSSEPIQGIRLLENQTFRVELGANASVTPRYVIESRLTSLAEETSAPSASMEPDGTFSYLWNFSAPLGPIALPNQQERPLTVQVEGDLKVHKNFNFVLENSTVVNADGVNKPINGLNETAQGTCHEQR